MNVNQRENAQRLGVLVDFDAKQAGKTAVKQNGPTSLPASLQNTLQGPSNAADITGLLPNMFLQTINFDAAFQELGLRGNTLLQPNGGQEDEEGTEVNPLEQQQVKEQAMLLQRFKELRQWQMQQQEKLMNQQKQQLELLRKEQMAIKSVIGKNKDSVRGLELNDDALTRTPPPSQRFVKPRFEPNFKPSEVRDSKSVPQQESLLASGQLPVPVMYVQFNEDNDEANTNPDLFSDTNSHTSEMTEERLYREEMAQRRVRSPDRIDSSEKEEEEVVDEDDNYEDEEGRGEESMEKLSDYDLEERDFDDDDDEEEEEEEMEKEIIDPDDRPIVVTKTFEELLEEQLRAESENQKHETERSVESPKHQFLKKGEGIARFGALKEKKANMRPPHKPPSEKPNQHSERPTSRNTTRPTNTKTLSSKGNAQKPEELKKNDKALRSGQPVITKPSGSRDPSESSRSVKPSNTQSLSLSNKTGKGSNTKQDPVRKKNFERKSSFPDDASYVGKLREREINEELEKGDLEEFELLENLADNMSYCSNTSLMVRKMEDRVKEKKRPSKLTLKPFSKKSKSEAQKSQNEKITVKPAENSAPVESEKREPVVQPNRESVVQPNREPVKPIQERYDYKLEESEEDETDSDDSESSDSESGTSDIERDTDNYGDKDTVGIHNGGDYNANHNAEVSPSKFMKRKIAQRDKSSPVPQVTRERNVLHLFKSSGVEKTIEIKTDYINQSGLQSDSDESEKGFQMHSKLLDRNTDDSDSEGSLVSYSDLNIKRKQEEGKNKTTSRKPDIYDDEEEWGDTTLKAVSPHPPNQKSEQEEQGGTPPTSKLMAKLFPKLKKAETKETQNQPNFQVNNVMPSEGLQSKLLREKLSELDKEIEKFRNENANLQKLRIEREDGLSKLKKEVADFEKEKSDELKRIQEYKTEEMKKLRHEKKVFEQLQKAKRNNPDKKEREEIEMLKTQLKELQEEMKRKELRWASNDSRTKEKLKLLENENLQLKEEIKAMERKRLEWLQKEKNAQLERNSQHEKGAQGTNTASAIPKAISTSAEFQMTDSDEEKDPVRDIPINKAGSFMSSHIPQQTGRNRQQNGEVPAASRQRPITSSGNLYSAQPDIAVNPRASQSDGSQGIKEEVPRGDPIVSAVPQDTSIYTEGGMDGSYLECVPRKTAQKYSIDRSVIDKGDKRFREIQHPDGKVEKIYSTGVREILFPNRTRKEISADGKSVVVSFFNGDVKQVTADQRVIYYYAEVQTTHSTYPDGLEIIQFPNNQVEKHYPEGTKEIIFPDQTIKYLFLNGSEESIFPDGTVIRVDRDGTKTMEFPNGQKEIHTQEYKRREYPDGTVKTVYPDGRQETKYSNGRIRVKDRDGNVIIDRRS